MVECCHFGFEGTAAGGVGMIEVTLLQKTNGPLTKRIKLADDGRLLSDGSVCVMGTGTARRVRLNGLSDFASQIHNLAENQAIALGALDAALPDQVQVVSKRALDQKNGHAAPDMIARTGGYISYKSGEAALALLDYDSKGMPPSVADRVRQAGGFW